MTVAELTDQLRENIVLLGRDVWQSNGFLRDAQATGLSLEEALRLGQRTAQEIATNQVLYQSIENRIGRLADPSRSHLIETELNQITNAATSLGLSPGFVRDRWVPSVLARRQSPGPATVSPEPPTGPAPDTTLPDDELEPDATIPQFSPRPRVSSPPAVPTTQHPFLNELLADDTRPTNPPSPPAPPQPRQPSQTLPPIPVETDESGEAKTVLYPRQSMLVPLSPAEKPAAKSFVWTDSHTLLAALAFVALVVWWMISLMNPKPEPAATGRDEEPPTETTKKTNPAKKAKKSAGYQQKSVGKQSTPTAGKSLSASKPEAYLGEPTNRPAFSTAEVSRTKDYDEVIDEPGDVGLRPARRSRNKRWGYIDGNGIWQIAPQYNRALPFRPSGYAMVLSAGEWLMIDRDGGVVNQ